MEIKINLPRTTEADINLDEAETNGLIVIKPHFYQKTGAKPLAYFEVNGDHGAHRKFVLNIHGRDGRLVMSEAELIQPVFDRPAAERAKAYVGRKNKNEDENN